MSMEVSPQTTTHVYLQGKECLHVLASADELRVRWMRDGEWVLRWDALINDDGDYVNQRLDGQLAGALDLELMDPAASALLFQSMKMAATRLPLYPNPDIIRELTWFVLDEPINNSQS